MEGTWRISRYHVNLNFTSCTCPFAIYTGKTCKHMHALELMVEGEEGDEGDVEMYQRAIDPALFSDGEESDPDKMGSNIHKHLGCIE